MSNPPPDSATAETGITVARKQRISQRPWIKPAIGAVLLAAVLFTAPIVGWMSASGKIGDDVSRTAEQVNVNVRLFFEPKQFHRDTLSDLGVYAGRDREDATVLRLRAVSQGDLERISRLFWVESIEAS